MGNLGRGVIQATSSGEHTAPIAGEERQDGSSRSVSGRPREGRVVGQIGWSSSRIRLVGLVSK